MNTPPYQKVQLLKPSFLQRILKQSIVTNAVREVNNLLASEPLQEISRNIIDEIGKRYKIDLGEEFPLNLEEFYAVYLQFLISDQYLNYKGDNGLRHLQELLRINDDVVQEIHIKLGVTLYKKAVGEKIKDGNFNLQERALLEEFAINLRLPNKIAEEASLEVRQNFIQRFIDPIFRKKRLSIQDERQLEIFSKDLDISIFPDTHTKYQLQRFRLYWALENEALPVILSDTLLSKHEDCYMVVAKAKWYEPRSMGKGVYQLKLIESGTVYLTNKKILFVSKEKNSSIKLDRILNLHENSTGIEIVKDTGRNPVLKLSEKADIFYIILQRLARENKI